MKIGFPRALFYFDYFPFWSGFFHSLGIDVVTSPPTHRRIMENGLKKANDETCLPLKLLAGHIQALEKVDAIFLPRMVSVEANTYTCPKFLGIPESLLSAVPPGVPVLTVTINLRKGKRQVLKELQVFGLQLGKGKADIRKAFTIGQAWQKQYEDSRGMNWDFEKSMREVESTVKGSENPKNVNMPHHAAERLRIALVGHSYLIYEAYANLNLLERLRKMAEVKVVQHATQEEVDNHLLGLRKKLFWNHSKQIFGSGKKFVMDSEIDGIIYLSCFGCGTDSIVQGLLAHSAREQHKPYMMIILDEHSGEAGLVTRLEAFLDMVERRKAHEDYVSAHGEHLDCYSNTV
ncbi:MAG: acyl-CoA dehydratase activase-related protein [Desulfosporosinus sp.]